MNSRFTIRGVLSKPKSLKRRAIHRSALGSSEDLEILEQRSLLTAQLGPAIAGHEIVQVKTSFNEEVQKSSREDLHAQKKNQTADISFDYSGNWKVVWNAFSKLGEAILAINQQLTSLAMTASVPDIGNINAPGKVKGSGEMVAKVKVNTPDGPSRVRAAIALTSNDVFDGTMKIKLPGLPKETGTLHGERQQLSA